MSNLEQNLIDNFGSYKDFPKPGIVFCDILPILRKPELFHELIQKMSSSKSVQESEALLAIDARGFIFGTALAQLTKKPLVLARKPGKLRWFCLRTPKKAWSKKSLLMVVGFPKRYA